MTPMPKEIEEVGKWVDVVTEFGVTYGFQILGALVFLIIGLKVASLVGRKVSGIAEAKNIDPTLSRFFWLDRQTADYYHSGHYYLRKFRHQHCAAHRARRRIRIRCNFGNSGSTV